MELELPASHVPSVNLSTKAHRDKHRSQRRVMYPIMMMSFTMTPDVISNSNYVMIDQSSVYSSTDATFANNRNNHNNNYNYNTTSTSSITITSSSHYNGQSHQLKMINDLWNRSYPDLPSDGKLRQINNSQSLPQSISSDSIVTKFTCLPSSLNSSTSSSPSSTPSPRPSPSSSPSCISACKEKLKDEKSCKSILIKSTPSTNAEKSLVNRRNSKSSHVYFVLDLITFHTYEDDDDSRSSRRGNWKTDADRFKHRIETLEIILKPILHPQHRSKVWLKLHQQSDQSEVN